MQQKGQLQHKNSLIVVGGDPMTGKSTLAQNLANRIGNTTLILDHGWLLQIFAFGLGQPQTQGSAHYTAGMLNRTNLQFKENSETSKWEVWYKGEVLPDEVIAAQEVTTNLQLNKVACKWARDTQYRFTLAALPHRSVVLCGVDLARLYPTADLKIRVQCSEKAITRRITGKMDVATQKVIARRLQALNNTYAAIREKQPYVVQPRAATEEIDLVIQTTGRNPKAVLRIVTRNIRLKTAPQKQLSAAR